MEKKQKDKHYVCTEKEELILQLTHDSYLDLLRNKYVLLTCSLYGIFSLLYGYI